MFGSLRGADFKGERIVQWQLKQSSSRVRFAEKVIMDCNAWQKGKTK